LAFAAAALVAARPRPPPLPIPALRGGFQLPPFNNANANNRNLLLGVNIHFAFETHFPTLGVDPIAQVDGLAQATLRNEDALRRLPDVARKTLQRRKEQVDRVRAYAAENNTPTATAAAVTDHFIPLTQVVERIARLSPFPPRRIALNDALELAKAARSHLSSFPEIVDEDIFVEAVGWSRSKFARLEKGVSMINGDGGANERLSKLRSAVEEADTLLLRQQQQQQQQQQQTSPQTSPLSSIVLPVVSHSPGGGVVGGSVPGVLPVATVGRLISAVDFASPVLTWHRKTDGGCCYIKDASEEWLSESVLLIRRACLIGFTVLTQQCERIRARDGTRWDASARIDQVKRTAEFLASADLAVSRAQNEHAIWWGRRCSFNENEFELLANDPKARASGDALYIADGEGPLSDIPAESAEIIAGFRAVGAERALLVDSTGSPLPLGIAFSSAAMTLVHSVRARSSTVDSIAEALSAFESNNRSNNNSCVMMSPLALTLDSDAMSTPSLLTPQKVNNDKESMNSPSSPTTSTATASAVSTAAATLDSLLGSIRTGSTQRSLNIIKSVLNSVDDSHVSVLKSHGTSGLSPLQLAISTGDVEVVKALLLEAKIDPASSINKTDSGGGTGSNALHAIAAKGGPSSLVMLDAALAALKSTDRNLSERRRVLDSINSAGVTCMHLAARNVVSTRREAFSAVLALLNAGASPLVKSASGHQRPAKTALQNLVEVHCSTSSAGAASERETKDTSSLSSGNMTVLSGAALSAGLERFLFHEQFADVAIIVSRDGSEDEDIDKGANSFLSTNGDKVSIPAHRVILASLSEFFETLLCGEWRETGSRQVQLSGCSEIHARRILCFAYTGRLDIPPGDARTALDLLRIASRYRAMTLVNVLQSFCSSPSCLTVQTAWMTYDVAVECGFDASRLKDAAVGFILQNYESVVGREGKDEDEEDNDLKTEASSTTFKKALLQLLRNEILVE